MSRVVVANDVHHLQEYLLRHRQLLRDHHAHRASRQAYREMPEPAKLLLARILANGKAGKRKP